MEPWSSPGCYCVTRFGYGAAAANELKVDLEEARLSIPPVSGLPAALHQPSHCAKDKDALSRALFFLNIACLVTFLICMTAAPGPGSRHGDAVAEFQSPFVLFLQLYLCSSFGRSQVSRLLRAIGNVITPEEREQL